MCLQNDEAPSNPAGAARVGHFRVPLSGLLGNLFLFILQRFQDPRGLEFCLLPPSNWHEHQPRQTLPNPSPVAQSLLANALAKASAQAEDETWRL